jgi:23S rRNA-/tRNA-specific pseudouridylate synthase
MDDPRMSELSRTLQVGPREAGMRADVYLSTRFESLSRRRAALGIRGGGIRSARRALKPSTTLREGEVLLIDLPGLAPELDKKPDCPPLLHQGPGILAFDKPAGVLMHPVGQGFAWGLINLARDPETNRQLKAAFKARQITKTYWAIVHGAPGFEETLVDAPLASDESSPIRLKQGVVAGGAEARTRVRVLARFEHLSLVSCRPETGRTHQIRVHLEHLGHPILGDRIYGQEPDVFLGLYEDRPVAHLRGRLGHPRHCLHARALHIPRPEGLLSLRAPMPPDMARVLRRAQGLPC